MTEKILQALNYGEQEFDKVLIEIIIQNRNYNTKQKAVTFHYCEFHYCEKYVRW